MTMETEAYRYWLGLMLIHAATGVKTSRELIERHLRDLKDGVPLEHKDHAVLSDAQFDEENLKRYPMYEAVAMEIIERLVAYEHSHDIRDLGLA